MNGLKIYIWALTIYFLLIIAGIFLGKIAFGHGSGDLLFLVIIGFVFIAYLIWTISYYKRPKFKVNKQSLVLPLVLFTLIALLLTYKFTLGRGPEFLWNGQVFYS
jgi:membrane protein CcdC involved in cytochrome C biogenesis